MGATARSGHAGLARTRTRTAPGCADADRPDRGRLAGRRIRWLAASPGDAVSDAPGRARLARAPAAETPIVTAAPGTHRRAPGSDHRRRWHGLRRTAVRP